MLNRMFGLAGKDANAAFNLNFFSYTIYMHTLPQLLQKTKVRRLFIILFTFSIFFGSLIVPIESGDPQANITNYLDSTWWTVSTITTVGYGDFVPVTDVGKVLGMVLQFTGLIAETPKSQTDTLSFEEDFQIKYSLQNVTKEELISIPKIGIKKADDIIDYRENFGFQNKIDLMKVKGIGQKTYLKIEPYFHDFGISNVILTNTNNKININTADILELQNIKGIGEVKAKKIIEYRINSGEFKKIEDLLNVSGIGEKTLEKIKIFITLGENNE